jgi:1,2-diacylglycerol 3-alpha-glucosyltransferase
MKSVKHIALLIPGFAKDEADDSCIPPVQIMLEEFTRSFPGYRFSIIAFQYPFTKEPYRWKGIPVFPCGGKNKKSIFRIFTWRRAMRYFRELHASDPVDVVHSFWFSECAFVGERIRKRFGIPHLNTLMGQDALPQNSYLKLGNMQDFPAVALSERHARTFEENTGRKPVAVIPWGTEEIKKSPEEKTIDVLVAGSLIPLKRTELAIETAAVLIKEFPLLKMVIAGDGAEKEKLRALVKNLNLEKNISFAGQVSRKEVLRLMHQSKTLLHPSSYESFGYVFAEALACGIPIVSFGVGVAKEQEWWRVVEHEAEMIEAVKKFVAVSTQPGKKFAVDETVKLYEKLYAEISS